MPPASSPAACGSAFPSSPGPAWDADALEFSDDGDAREAMGRALRAVRGLVQFNPDNRLPASLQAKVLELCTALEALLSQWERSKGALSLQEGFHARHIAISYLPDALKTYLSIPAAVRQHAADPRRQDGGRHLPRTLVELEGKVAQLADDLASQDAHAFLAHSQFLHDKFGAHRRPPGARRPRRHPWRARPMATADPRPTPARRHATTVPPPPTFQLTPPEVITPVPAESTPTAVPLAPETASGGR